MWLATVEQAIGVFPCWYNNSAIKWVYNPLNLPQD